MPTSPPLPERVEAEQVSFQADDAARWLAAQQRYPRQWRDAASLNEAPCSTIGRSACASSRESSSRWSSATAVSTPADPKREQVTAFVDLFPRIEQEQ